MSRICTIAGVRVNLPTERVGNPTLRLGSSSVLAVRVRRATPEDAPIIAAIEVVSWRAAYRGLMPAAFLDGLSVSDKAATWESDIAQHGPAGRKRVLVAEENSRVVGFSLAGIPTTAPAGVGLLYYLYIAPQAWRHGAGKSLMDKVMDDFAQQKVSLAHLWVLRRNVNARGFYEATGWQLDDESQVDNYGGVALEAVRYSIGVN